jgi:hypothetical protein
MGRVLLSRPLIVELLAGEPDIASSSLAIVESHVAVCFIVIEEEHANVVVRCQFASNSMIHARECRFRHHEFFYVASDASIAITQMAVIVIIAGIWL